MKWNAEAVQELEQGSQMEGPTDGRTDARTHTQDPLF